MVVTRSRFWSFTLVELLITLVIVGILAAALVSRVQGIRERARYTQVEKDFQFMQQLVFLAHVDQWVVLRDITGSGCSDCVCRSIGDLRDLDDSHQCVSRWLLSLERIATSAWMSFDDVASLQRDPRWSPYLLDENEWEFAGDICRPNMFRSAGSDGLIGGDNTLTLNDLWCNYSY
jgi:prepilin-type N-terminal cleavage/methylation domain-containing protein